MNYREFGKTGEKISAPKFCFLKIPWSSFHDEPSSIKHIIDGAEKYGVPMESMLAWTAVCVKENARRAERPKGLIFRWTSA